MNVNPATGEVTIQNAQLSEDSKNSAIQWEENRRRQSIMQREAQRTSLLPHISKGLTSVDEDESEKEHGKERDVREEGANQKLISLKQAGIKVATLQKG